MRKMSLITSLAVTLLILSLFAPRVHASEPPISDPHTFWEASIGWGPINADPASAYDSASGELLFNSMQGLIAFNGELYDDFVPVLATNVPSRQSITMSITNISVVNADPTGSQWTNGSTVFNCFGWVDEGANGFGANDVIYLNGGNHWRAWTIDSKTGASTITLDLWRGSYVFNIRTNPTIYFYDETGATADSFNVIDAEYSLRRGLVQDQLGSPMWMFYKPLFDQMNHDYWTNSTAMDLAHLISDAVVGDQSVNTLTINVGIRFPDSALKQVLANTYGSIGSKEFSLSIGCWNGNLYDASKYGGPFPDWWIDWSDIPSSPYEQNRRYCGTGPYHVVLVDSVNQRSIMQKNQGFWQGWPASGCNASLDTVVIDYISYWVTRRDAFVGGFYDSCAVPRSDMFELLTDGEPTDLGIKTIKQIVPELSMDAFMFNFAINDQSPYIVTGQLPDGIPTNFFNDTHVRKAFAHAFNATQYGEQVYYSESEYRKNWLIPGLIPDYYNASISGYDIDFVSAENELKLAKFEEERVWDKGFTFYLAYNAGDDARMVACYMIRDFFTTLSTYDDRTGHAFTVNLIELPWSIYIADYLSKILPMSDFGWVADFPDADNFARSYMHSDGPLARFQSYTDDNGWGSTKDTLVEQALLTPDGSARQALYNQLAQIYYNDCPSVPIVIPHGRQWCWYWVKGWYYNALYPSTYYYTIWKQDDCWFDVSGPTVGVSDGIVNMRDSNYLLQHFNARAPIPGQPPDPKWVGVYGANGCVDPSGDRICNMRDIQGCILHFNHKNNTGTP